MNEGVIEQIGTPEDLSRRPVSPFVADFVGLSNVLDGIARGILFTDAGGGMDATAVASSFLGSLRRTVVRAADGTLIAVQHDASDRREADEAVRLRFAGYPVVARSR
ncbi:MAG: ABC-type spermidine/putrescine transport system, ATPase component [Microbacterium sp.]|nr:ABC-type spermidine/putrescine transport system, ATPase component [Microbacterium sp.]